MSPAPAPQLASDNAPGPAAARFRVAVEYALAGDLRFLSHHDEVRMLARALVRAGWPLAYSRGFNPRPRLAMPLPRNLGIEAGAQVALIELRVPCPAVELHASLARQLPAGCRLLRVIAPAPRLGPQAVRTTYELDLDQPDVELARQRIAGLLARPGVPIQREYGPHKPARAVDIRPFIERVELDGRTLRLVLRYAAQRTARPSEVINELGLAAETYNCRFRRAAVQWNMELAGSDSGPAAHERTKLDDQEDDHQEEDCRRKKDRGQPQAHESPDPGGSGGF